MKVNQGIEVVGLDQFPAAAGGDLPIALVRALAQIVERGDRGILGRNSRRRFRDLLQRNHRQPQAWERKCLTKFVAGPAGF